MNDVTCNILPVSTIWLHNFIGLQNFKKTGLVDTYILLNYVRSMS